MTISILCSLTALISSLDLFSYFLKMKVPEYLIGSIAHMLTGIVLGSLLIRNRGKNSNTAVEEASFVPANFLAIFIYKNINGVYLKYSFNPSENPQSSF